MFWLRNKKNNFLVCTLIWRPDLNSLSSSVVCWQILQTVRSQIRPDQDTQCLKQRFNIAWESSPTNDLHEILLGYLQVKVNYFQNKAYHFKGDLSDYPLKRQSRLQQTTNFVKSLILEKNKVWYFIRIVCQQTILMKYHALFVIFEKAAKF